MRRRLEPDALDDSAFALPGVDFHLAARRTCRRGTRRRRGALGAHRPYAAAAARAARAGRRRRRGSRRCTAPSSTAAGCRRCDRASRRCSRVGSRDSRTRRASASLRASASAHLSTSPGGRTPSSSRRTPRAAAAVEHRHDGVQPQPGIALQTAQQAGQAGAATKAADVELTHLHRSEIVLSCPCLPIGN